jgi:putative Mg2+ transporter-C (MgtC) family protein
MTTDTLDVVARLALAAVLSGVIGLEREVAQKNAGLRTHMLVGLGAGVFTLLSLEFPRSPVSDPARIAAQIVTGVGFLGAGAIFRSGFSVRGLTTAAGLWSAAAVGMAAGAAFYTIAVVATVVSVAVLYLVGVSQWFLRGRREHATTAVRIRISDPGLVGSAREAAAALVAPGGEVAIHEIGRDRATIHLTVEPRAADGVMASLADIPGVDRVFRVEG